MRFWWRMSKVVRCKDCDSPRVWAKAVDWLRDLESLRGRGIIGDLKYLKNQDLIGGQSQTARIRNWTFKTGTPPACKGICVN